MKGILFKPWKIKFIAEHPDVEIQTRRVIKPRPKNPFAMEYSNGKLTYREKITYEGGFYFGEWQHTKPHYQVGETVYVKETYWADLQGGVWGYKSDMEWPSRNCAGKGVSALFMPEWAARHFTKILAVRAERLQEITEEDAISEGIQEWEGMFKEYGKPDNNPGWTREPILSYQTLWDSLNAKRGDSWESNPWVWVIEFKKVRP